MSSAQVLSAAHALLETHHTLLQQVRSTQRHNRDALRSYLRKHPTPSVDADSSSLEHLLELPLLRTPHHSPLNSSKEVDGVDEDDEDDDGDLASEVASVVRPHPREVRPDLPPAKKARCARYENYIPEEETIRNDYCQRYVDGGEWPQNWVVGAEMERRFEE